MLFIVLLLFFIGLLILEIGFSLIIFYELFKLSFFYTNIFIYVFIGDLRFFLGDLDDVIYIDILCSDFSI